MKRYAVFGGDVYYPGGGWDDFIDAFDDEIDAINAAIASEQPKPDGHWSQVIDLATGKEIQFSHPKGATP